jgi:transcriptional regulator with XRE-family HTH domain
MGIPFSTYRRYEKKEREPDASVLVQMADFYNVSLDYLVGRSDKREG